MITINKEWLEVELTKDQLSLLEEGNIISGGLNTTYALGLGNFYKIESNGKCFTTWNTDLLPDYVLSSYKEILENICSKLKD